jgi:hypothetical protein
MVKFPDASALCKIRRTRPIHEARFNFGTFSVCANRALSLVPGTIHLLLVRDAFQCAFHQRVLRACGTNRDC